VRTHMIGSGAMGSVDGGLLAHAGCDVTLMDPREDHIGTLDAQRSVEKPHHKPHPVRYTAGPPRAGGGGARCDGANAPVRLPRRRDTLTRTL
jgi:hypothetical protein